MNKQQVKDFLLETKPSVDFAISNKAKLLEQLTILKENPTSDDAWKTYASLLGSAVDGRLNQQSFARKTLDIKDMPFKEDSWEITKIHKQKRFEQCAIVTYCEDDNAHNVRAELEIIPKQKCSADFSRYMFPPEYYLDGTLYLPTVDFKKPVQDILNGHCFEFFKNFLLKEDKLWRDLMLLGNDIFIFNNFNSAVFHEMTFPVAQRGAPTTTLVIALDVMKDILEDEWLSEVWVPPESFDSFDSLYKGDLGMLSWGDENNRVKIQIVTDGFRPESLRVLQPGEIFTCGAQEKMGAIIRKTDLLVQYKSLEEQEKWATIIGEKAKDPYIFLYMIEAMGITCSLHACGRKTSN